MPPRRNYTSFNTYIHKVLKQVHPGTGLSMKAMYVIDDMLKHLFRQIMSESINLGNYNNHQTISSRDVQTSIRLILPGELAKHAVSEGVKSVTKFCSKSYESENDKTSTTNRSTRAGLQFPVGRIHKMMKIAGRGKRIGSSAPVYLAAVLEYICAEGFVFVFSVFFCFFFLVEFYLYVYLQSWN
eukprot:TRINITY_DN2401_c0_g2_i2.p1 TRINITY_DN2401_c0_g2~~TRINITY_DN2401_c0_g2_i2.p1  ORF type:complete len:184 (+),score=12.21 TRINITY_DN2401_c0_g2_i2:32-583(+)